MTRQPTPEPSQNAAAFHPTHSSLDAASAVFPFQIIRGRVGVQELLAQLPSREEAWPLVNSYYRYVAWQ